MRDEGEIRVYRIDLACDADEVARMRALLSEDEQHRADRFINPDARVRFVVCRGALRQILASSIDRDPRSLVFSYSSLGKPALSPQMHLSAVPDFNVSHSAELALIAVGADGPIGIDVERVRHLDNAMGIARRFFSRAEVQALEAIPAEDTDRAFFRCWTRKEAYVKGLGEGMQCPLSSFQVDFADDVRASLLHVEQRPQDSETWKLAPLVVDTHFVAAVAFTGDRRVII